MAGKIKITEAMQGKAVQKLYMESLMEMDADGVLRALGAGASLDDPELHGKTALMHASHGNGDAVVKALLAYDKNVGACAENGMTALGYAVLAGAVGCAELLLKAGADPNGRQLNGRGRLPLLAAAKDGNVKLVRMLAAYGADLDQKDGQGDTALIGALKEKRGKVALALIDLGCGLEHKNNEGFTALMMAAYGKMGAVVEKLCAMGAKWDTVDNDGDNALMMAAYSECERSAKALVKAGADVDRKGRYGRTALMMALLNTCNEEVPFVLLNAHAAAGVQDEDGMTALMYSARSGGVGCEALLKAGVDLDAKNKEGETALMCAAQGEAVECARMLIAAGADVDAQNNDGNNALMLSMMGGDGGRMLMAVEVLIEAGANLSLANKKSETALSMASEMGLSRCSLAIRQRMAENERAEIAAVSEDALSGLKGKMRI